MLSNQDKQQLKTKGISEEELQKQLNRFKKGFPFLKIKSAATVGQGVLKPTKDEIEHYEKVWDRYVGGNCRVTKFVPASGAASRMFKDLFGFLEAAYDIPTTDFEKEFFEGLSKFAFYDELDDVCKLNTSNSISELLASGQYKTIVENLLDEKGLSYGVLPKGLLEFHKYKDSTRKSVEEHLVEGSLYASNKSGDVNIHFTVSPEHRTLFQNLLNNKITSYEKDYNAHYNISFSEQKPSTDTIAVDMNNELFRDGDEMLFRPGGHGALIENLNEIDSDVIFIKNVDNVIPDKLRKVETLYKKVTAGILVETQNRAFEYLRLLDKGTYTHEQLIEILYFLQKELNIKNPDTKLLEDGELALYLKKKLDRPMRVCGVVRNEGEPGGGPFLVVNSDGTVSPQILESSQIDATKEENISLVKSSTHFNPVDLVCAVRNYKGEKYNLLKFVDETTGFISLKSKAGKSLKALELPGLWNGAMSDWNTIFVEVPIATFNPVKTINDLLRANHL